MKSYVTYCSACDSEVLVTLDPDAEQPLDPSNVICLDRVASSEEKEIVEKARIASLKRRTGLES